MASIADYKKQHPEYANIPDRKLADILYEKGYKGKMDETVFYKTVFPNIAAERAEDVYTDFVFPDDEFGSGFESKSTFKPTTTELAKQAGVSINDPADFNSRFGASLGYNQEQKRLAIKQELSKLYKTDGDGRIGPNTGNMEYFNPETGETRIINFYNDVAVNEIPEGFVLKEDYVKDETTTTDLESTSVDSTRVTGDDKSSDKIRLSNMTRQQSSNALSSLKNADPDAILDAWNKNQKTKAVMTSLALINPIVGMAGRAAASHFGNQLEKLMSDKKIAIPKQTEEKQNFIEKLGSGISNFFTGEEEGSTYASTYRPENSPLGMNADRNLLTSTNTGSMFTTSEAQAYDNAINSGNVDVARHYEIVNNRYNKMADFAAGKSVSGLNKYDKEQARSLFDSKGNRQFDTVNQANKDADSKIQKIAAANAEKIAAANLDNRKSDPKLANKKSTSTTSSEKNFVEKVFDSISSFFGGGSDDD